MQRVLIPIDFTKRSRSVLTHITKICNPEKYHFILYHNYAKSNTDEILISVEDIIENEISNRLEKEAAFLKSQIGSRYMSFEIKVDKGELVSTLSDSCENNSIDLVVLGSENGNSWTSSSNGKEIETFYLVKYLKCPVLIIPQESAISYPNEVVFATRLNSTLNENEVAPLVKVLNDSKAHLDIVSFTKEEKQDKENVNKVAKNVDGYFKQNPHEIHVISEADPYSGILQFSKEHKADLLCIMYRKTSFLERMLRESVSKQMLNDVNLPIMVLKQNI